MKTPRGGLIFVNWKRVFFLGAAIAFMILSPGPGQPLNAQGAIDVFASPVQAGCYLVRRDVCKIHVDPFTINVTSGKKLVSFQLLATRAGARIPRPIYDFSTDQSNPVPFIGDSYTPSLVAKDFAASCGHTYTLSLVGKDSGDGSALAMGTTQPFSCPTGTHIINLPSIFK